MSNTPPRHSPSPTPSSSTHHSKLPKFLRHHQSRDRSRSLNEGSSGASSSESANPPPKQHRQLVRKSSRLFGVRERDEKSPKITSTQLPGSEEPVTPTDSLADPPIIVEPPSVSGSPSSYQGGRITDIPSRLTGWIQHAFTASTTDLPSYSMQASLPNPLSQSVPASSSPRSLKGRTNSNAGSLISHIPGKANLERAVRYLLDSDIAQPDKCTAPIWLMGVEHPGYQPPTSPPVPGLPSRHRRDSTDSSIRSFPRRSTPPPITARTQHGTPYSQHSNPSLQSLQTVTNSLAARHTQPKEQPWPEEFYEDFTSCIWLTYRTQYAPIRDITLQSLEPPILASAAVPLTDGDNAGRYARGSPPLVSSPLKSRWGWGGEKGWTSDTGWGCMLRTGQSLLANALIHLHLSRDWRRPLHPSNTVEYATYVMILTWFLDTPSPLSPFSIHRMALAGKTLGKEVGCWFGPSSAAGAIKTLAHAFPAAELAVSIATDSVLFESEVYAASNLSSPNKHQPSISTSLGSATSRRAKAGRRRWGGSAVLVLIGIRLGIDRVNPIYYETVKTLFTFPQSVGIAGGRPSSSYYFVGYQDSHLFYLDPHHPRPTVSLQPTTAEGTDSDAQSQGSPVTQHRRGSTTEQRDKRRKPTSPTSSSRSSALSTVSSNTPASPISRSSSRNTFPLSSSSPAPPSPSLSSSSSIVDPLIHHYATAYAPSDLRTFHCDRVRKMPLNGLDPSMLLGFLCRDEEDWKDFRKRVGELAKVHRTIFSIEDDPPSWGEDSDDDVGMESMSETDSEMISNEDYTSSDLSGAKADSSQDSHDYEDDVGGVTPGPNVRAFFGPSATVDDDGEEEWINPSPPPPSSSTTSPTLASNGGSRPPAPQGHYPFPVSEEDGSRQRQSVPVLETQSVRMRNGGRTASGGVKGVVWTAGSHVVHE